MRLSELAAHVSATSLRGDGDTEITSVSYDSRSASPGSIFVAIAGFKADGHDYLEQALEERLGIVDVEVAGELNA